MNAEPERGGTAGQGRTPVSAGAAPSLRVLRIVAIMLTLPILFFISQRVGEVRGNEPIPGMSWALGGLSGLFLVRAVVAEHSLGAEESLQKDLLWGLAAGGFLTIITRCWL